jgi:hypothetical protein
MTEKIHIGSVCEKGNHLTLRGESDYGACGSHHYAEVYVIVERNVHEDGPRHYGRGHEPDLASIAAEIASAASALEQKRWEE